MIFVSLQPVLCVNILVMLNRRVLRAKVLQAVYAYVESGEENVEVGVKYLLESIDKLYELFIWQLSFLVETKRFAERRIDENKHKHIPTPEDLNPNMRYVNNWTVFYGGKFQTVNQLDGGMLDKIMAREDA